MVEKKSILWYVLYSMESKNLIRKLILSFWFIAASAGYIFYSQLKSNSLTAPEQSTSLKLDPNVISVKGIYNDGSYTGLRTDAYYGMVQVKATVKNGNLTDVVFLEYPSSHGTSRYINGQAMPILKQEAIEAQEVKVNIVSGATETSIAFWESLDSALTQAKN